MTADWDPGFCSRSPLYWPIRAAGALLSSMPTWPTLADYAALGAGHVRFESAPPRPRGARRKQGNHRAGYDETIVDRGVVPTRLHNWHDLYNALVWATFPRAKRQLHRRQGELAAQDRSGGARRAPEHDVLAMLDEGGVVVLASTAREGDVRAALRREDEAALARSDEASETSRIVFGHAIYESLRTEATSIWAMSIVLVCDVVPSDLDERCRLADDLLAAELSRPIRAKAEYPRLAVPW